MREQFRLQAATAEDPLVAAETNRLERLRDPSHGRTLTVAELHGLLSAAGAVVGCTHG